MALPPGSAANQTAAPGLRLGLLSCLPRIELPPIAATNKCLARMSKTGAGIRATKGHRPDGVGRSKE